MLQNNQDSLKINFSEYLTKLGLSSKSHKNYRSDLTHFSGWVILKIRSLGSYIETLTECVPFLSKEIANEYKNYMIENKIPVKTVNRRLSTLRHLARHLTQAELTDCDFMQGIENISLAKKMRTQASNLVDNFRGYLETEKVSQNTVKNYVSDVHQFMDWLEAREKNQIHNDLNK